MDAEGLPMTWRQRTEELACLVNSAYCLFSFPLSHSLFSSSVNDSGDMQFVLRLFIYAYIYIYVFMGWYMKKVDTRSDNYSLQMEYYRKI